MQADTSNDFVDQTGRATYAVFDAITSFPQYVILEVQQLEACMDVLDEPADLKRA